MLTRTIVTLMTVAAISGGAVSSAQAAPNAAKKFECYHDGNPKHFRPGCPIKEKRARRYVVVIPPPPPPPTYPPATIQDPQDIFERLMLESGGGAGGAGGGGAR